MGDSGPGDKATLGIFANPNSGPKPVSAAQSLDEQMKVYLNYLPQLNAANAQSGVQTAQMQQPAYNQLNFEQLQKYGLPTAQLQQQISNSNAMAGANTNNQLLTGAGGQAAVNATALNRLINPNYYSVADNTARQTNNLLNSFNTRGLSPGEQNAVERSNNQFNSSTGNLGLSNPTNSIANAINFGGAFNSKLGMLGNALGTAQNSANMLASNGGVNGVGIALGTNQPNQANVNSFANPNYTTQSADVSQSLLSGINSSANQQNKSQETFNWQNSERGKLDAGADAMGKICCFIFLEATNGQLPWYVRAARDYFYQREPVIAVGYKRMAKWLVPLMKEYRVVKFLVNWLMVKPIIKYGAYLYYCNRDGFIFRPFKSFWFFVWKQLGKGDK